MKKRTICKRLTAPGATATLVMLLSTTLLFAPRAAQGTVYDWLGGYNNQWDYVKPSDPCRGCTNWGTTDGTHPDSYADQARIEVATYNPVQARDEYNATWNPSADSIILLGGGIGGNIDAALYIGNSASIYLETAAAGGRTLGMQGNIWNNGTISLRANGILRNDGLAGTQYTIDGSGTINFNSGEIASLYGGKWVLNQPLEGIGFIYAPVVNNSTMTTNSTAALYVQGPLTNESNCIINVGTAALHTGALIFNAAASSLSNFGIVDVYGTFTNTSPSNPLSLAETGGILNLYGGALNGNGNFTNAGSVIGYGTISNGLVNGAASTIEATANAGNVRLTINPGVGHTFRNQGTVMADGNATVAIVAVDPLTFDTATKTLSEGTWHATGAIRFNWLNGKITNNNAYIILDGPGAYISGTTGSSTGDASSALNKLENNSGTLELINGANLTISVTLFTNSGTVTIDGLSSLTFL